MSDAHERDEDKRARREDEDDLEEALEDLGRSFTRFLQKVMEKGEELFGGSGLEDLFRGPGEGFGGASPGRRRQARGPARTEKTAAQREPVVDVFDEGDEILIYVELPGVEDEHLDVRVADGVIHVKARSESGTFEKAIDIPAGTTSTPEYHFKNGILKIRLKKRKKKQAKSKGKTGKA